MLVSFRAVPFITALTPVEFFIWLIATAMALLWALAANATSAGVGLLLNLLGLY